ncbi:Hypothetical protein HVR_LOCUS1006 [uncultured virus]|nr:Hypothetical protein HVR_LOCUS1006 [uncultured virus]
MSEFQTRPFSLSFLNSVVPFDPPRVHHGGLLPLMYGDYYPFDPCVAPETELPNSDKDFYDLSLPPLSSPSIYEGGQYIQDI